MKRLLVSFVGGTVAFAVHAQVLFNYTFPGADPAGDVATPAAEHLTLSPFARANVSAVSQTDAFSSSRWSQTVAQDLTKYVSFTFRPDAGYEIGLTSVSWDASRSSTGPQFARVELFKNGTSLESGAEFAVGTTTAHQAFDFTPTSGMSSDTFEFRFYGWKASGTGNLRLDNVAVAGGVSAVPEPPTSGLVLAAGLLGLTCHRLRQARRSACLTTT